MTTFAVLPLQNGFLATPAAVFFTAAAVTYVKRLDLFNTNTTTEQIQIWLVPSGGSPGLIRQLSLGTQESAELIEDGESITLGVGDAIRGVTTTNSVVQWTVAGVTES